MTPLAWDAETGKLSDDVPGRATPAGHRVRYPWASAFTAVTLPITATAPVGTSMPPTDWPVTGRS